MPRGKQTGEKMKTTSKKSEFTKKEMLLFWNAILAGMVGGLIGNILVSYIFNFSKTPTWVNLAGVIIFTAIFFWIIFKIIGIIKKNIDKT